MQRSLVVPFTISLVCRTNRPTRTTKTATKIINEQTKQYNSSALLLRAKKQKSEEGQNRETEAKQRDLC